jgi:hypothetical protein
MRKLMPLLIVPLLALLAVAATAAQSGAATVAACASDCALPFTWQPPAGQGVVLVEIVTGDQVTAFVYPGERDGYSVRGVGVFSDGDPLIVSGAVTPDEIRVRLEVLPTPAPWCEPPAPDVKHWYCTPGGETVIIRETFLPLVLR